MFSIEWTFQAWHCVSHPYTTTLISATRLLLSGMMDKPKPTFADLCQQTLCERNTFLCNV